MKNVLANESRTAQWKALVRTTTDAIKVGISTVANDAMIVPLCTAGGAVGYEIRDIIHPGITIVGDGIMFGAALGATAVAVLGLIAGAEKWVAGIKTNLRA